MLIITSQYIVISYYLNKYNGYNILINNLTISEETEAIFEMSDFLQSLKKLPKRYHDINLS